MIKAAVHLDEEYTHNAVIQALKKSKQIEVDVIETKETPEDETIQLQWLEYELINWDLVAQNKCLVNAYCILSFQEPRQYLEKGDP
ncbi:hypothetical protein G6F57_023101 [Rhizopus arrhizus]|nr:hypothetical protein G6F57_023101 [Rhizopus arrhizus]